MPGAFLSGLVRGLSTTGLVLQNNLGGTLAVANNGSFMFPTPVSIGAAWTVTVQTQPSNAPPCTVTNGSGTLTTNVSNIVVSCGRTLRVSTEGGGPVPGASAVLVGPTRTVQATADGAGVFTIGFPDNERPFSLTVAAPNYEAVSVVGLTTEFPEEVFIAPTAQAPNSTAPLTGTITGKSAPANRVSVDVYDGNTVTTTASLYNSFYSVVSPAPVQVIALEVSSTNVLLNWVASAPLSRTSTGQMFNVVMPSPPAPTVSTTLTVAPAATGLFTAAGLGSMSTGGFVAHYTGNSASALDGGSSYVLSGWSQGSGAVVSASGVDGALKPNRALYSRNGANTFLRLWVRDPFASTSNVIPAPEVTSVTSTGAALNALSGEGVATGFDTLELQITGSGVNDFTTYWRIYTAPGAPLTITSLPPLPAGFSPSTLGATGSLNALPIVIRFAEPTARPWQMPGSDSSFPYYSATAAGSRRLIASTWP